MILFIDETENDDYFIVAGLLISSNDDLIKSFNRFKRKVDNFNIKPESKSKLCNEYKSVLMDKQYPKLKMCLLKEINNLDCKIYFSTYKKESISFKQLDKETQYISLLKNIVLTINEKISIFFDAFNKKDFDLKIINEMSLIDNVIKIEYKNSFDEKGIQFVDNIASTIRHSLSNKHPEFYEIIKDKIIKT